MRKGVQIYTVRDFIKTPEDYEDSLRKIKAIGYDSVQTYVSYYTPEEHKKLLDEIGLKSESAKADYEAMAKDPPAVEEAVRAAEIMDTDLISIGTLPIAYRDSEDGFRRYAENINRICEKLAGTGKKLVYHPHALEFYSLGGGRNGMDILTGETDHDVFRFVLDTHWLQSGGANPAAYIRKMKGRLPIIHFKDYKIVGGAEFIEQVRKDFAEMGEGNLYWPDIIDACNEAGIEAAVIEQDVCSRDPFDCLKTSYENMLHYNV